MINLQSLLGKTHTLSINNDRVYFFRSVKKKIYIFLIFFTLILLLYLFSKMFQISPFFLYFDLFDKKKHKLESCIQRVNKKKHSPINANEWVKSKTKKKNQIEFENEEWKKELKNIMYSRNYIIEMRRKKFWILV